MPKKNLLSGLFFCLLVSAPLSAATVSVLVVEAGLPKESSAQNYSAMWENSLMDVLFEAGHIVSNAPMLRLSKNAQGGLPDEADQDMNEAQKSGMGYFLIAVVSYPPPRSGAPRNSEPYQVSLRLFDSKSPEMLHEVNYTYKTPKSDKEEYENIKKAIREMTVRLQ
jgi:hypothetical protein